MTGITFEAATETYGKRLQILKEIVPDLKRGAVLRAVGDPTQSLSVCLQCGFGGYAGHVDIAEVGQPLFECLRIYSTQPGGSRAHIAYSPDLARLLSSRSEGQCQRSTVDYAD